jgi:tetratricopeptide (TPR) repeat protein
VIDDQAACLAIFLSDSKTPHDDPETIRLGREFLHDHPKSPLAGDVRMKLGQVYFRQGDYPNAETEFGNFAKESPKHPSAEIALFLAGQSAMRRITPGSTDVALAYFDQVVQRNGALNLHAREQQAIIQVRLGKEQEAVALYDLIINSRQPVADPELRSAALIGKAEALALLARKDPQQLAAAFDAYEKLAADADAGPSWRHRRFTKGQGCSQSNRAAESMPWLFTTRS